MTTSAEKVGLLFIVLGLCPFIAYGITYCISKAWHRGKVKAMGDAYLRMIDPDHPKR